MTEKTELCGRKKDTCGQLKAFGVEFTIYTFCSGLLLCQGGDGKYGNEQGLD